MLETMAKSDVGSEERLEIVWHSKGRTKAAAVRTAITLSQELKVSQLWLSD